MAVKAGSGLGKARLNAKKKRKGVHAKKKTSKNKKSKLYKKSYRGQGKS